MHHPQDFRPRKTCVINIFRGRFARSPGPTAKSLAVHQAFPHAIVRIHADLGWAVNVLKEQSYVLVCLRGFRRSVAKAVGRINPKRGAAAHDANRNIDLCRDLTILRAEDERTGVNGDLLRNVRLHATKTQMTVVGGNEAMRRVDVHPDFVRPARIRNSPDIERRVRNPERPNTLLVVLPLIGKAISETALLRPEANRTAGKCERPTLAEARK